MLSRLCLIHENDWRKSALEAGRQAARVMRPFPAVRSYPFTPPAVNPCTKKRWQVINTITTGISVISLIIVIYGAIIAFCAFIRNESRRFTGKYSFTATRELRADLGTYLLLGLEFLIASDILKTVLEPSLNELAILGGVVILRTILSIFLNKEIKELQVQKEGTGGPEKD